MLVKDLNKGLASPLDAAQIDLVFNKWWPDLDSEYKKALAAASTGVRPKGRSDRELLEELLH